MQALRRARIGSVPLIVVAISIAISSAFSGAAFAGNKTFSTRGRKVPSSQPPVESRFDRTSNGGRGLASVDESALAREEAAAVTVISLDPEIPLETFRESGYVVKDYEDSLGSGDPWREPDPQLRDRVFANAGLQGATAKWKQLDKDMLFLAAQEMSARELAPNFAKLSMVNFVRLQRAIASEKRKQK